MCSLALGLIAILVGCAPPPRGEALLQSAQENPGSPTFFGPDGRLSVQASKAIFERLDQHDPAFLRAQLDVAAALPDNSPLVIGNRAELLVNGPATFKAIMASVAGARQTIDMETYIFADDKFGRRLAQLFMEKQSQGVQVNLLYDSFGSLDTPSKFFDELRAAGAHVVEFNPLNPLERLTHWHPNDRDHRKLLIVDGKTVFTGGVNVSDVYSSSSFGFDENESRLPWRDTEVKITGPAAHYFQKLFLVDWRGQGGPPLSKHDYFPHLDTQGTQVVRAIASEAGGKPNRIYITLIAAIDNARQSVHITASYFAPDQRLLNALCAAARRGVDVTLVLPSKSDVWPVLYTGRSYYRELLSAGVHIYERQDVLLHAKTAVVDGVWSTIGSTNLDWRSLSLNAEVNAVLIGRRFGHKMEELFAHDVRHSNRVTLAQWQQRSLSERAKEFFGRLVARLM